MDETNKPNQVPRTQRSSTFRHRGLSGQSIIELLEQATDIPNGSDMEDDPIDDSDDDPDFELSKKDAISSSSDEEEDNILPKKKYRKVDEDGDKQTDQNPMPGTSNHNNSPPLLVDSNDEIVPNVQDDNAIIWKWVKEDLPFKPSDGIPPLSSKMLEKGLADEPLLYFEEMFTKENIEIIMIETNRYYEQRGRPGNLDRLVKNFKIHSSRYAMWFLSFFHFYILIFSLMIKLLMNK